MSSSSDRDDPLAPVLRPLRFAAKNDFSNLSVIRGVEAAVRAAAQAAEPHLDAPQRAQLQHVLTCVDGIDAADDHTKRDRIRAALGDDTRATPTKSAAPPNATTAAKSGSASAPTKSAAKTKSTTAAQPESVATRTKSAAPTQPAGTAKSGSDPAPRKSAAPPAAQQDELFKPAVTARRVRKAAPQAAVAERPTKRVPMEQATPGHHLADLVGVGPKTAERLASNRIVTVQDALFFLPTRYEDRTQFTTIDRLVEGEHAAVRGRVSAASMRMMGRRKRMFEIAVRDDTGTLSCRFFRFSKNQMEAKFARGVEVVVFGKVTKWGAMRQMVHPEMSVHVDDAPPAPEGIVPVYPEIQAVPKKTLTKIVTTLAEVAAAAIEDPLPEDLRERLGLAPLAEAVLRAHRPEPTDTTDPRGPLERMRARLVFDELFFLQLALARTRTARDALVGLTHRPDATWSQLAERLLPFELTGAQARALETIAKDLAASRPMNRLLMGDVGSGKTAVAFIAAALVQAAGRQTAILAPTEILASQHFKNALKLLEPAGFDVRLLTGSTKAAARTEILSGLRAKTVDVLVGTHAILEPAVRFADLGLAIVDEQHRFGVEQRAALSAKREDATPDVLVMTATPIPRTLSLTAYGDLRTTIIDELPPGRSPTETNVYPLKDRRRAYRIVSDELAAGRQAYVVFPLVEASEKLDLTAASDAVEELADRFAPKRVGLLHGRMKPDEKAEVMDAFVKGDVAVLVSTTVVEVGVDVENASVMVVEHAERFGLSQLHQLRGRVGRGQYTGRCVLLVDAKSKEGAERVQVLAQTSSGFEVAERDLELRGAGEILGTRQSGLAELHLADLVRDAAVLERARDEAFAILEGDPDLAEHAALAAELERRYAERLALSRVG